MTPRARTAAHGDDGGAETAGPTHVALLRGINVGGNRKLPMAALRELATGLGWCDVATYVASGNLLFRAPAGAPVAAAAAPAAAAAAKLARAIETEFGFAVPVVVRALADVRADLAHCPLADALAQRPKFLHVGYAAAPLATGLAKNLPRELAPYCRAGEVIVVRGDALWIDFTNGVARSKLTSPVLDRLVGAPVTLRNANTVRELAGSGSAG